MREGPFVPQDSESDNLSLRRQPPRNRQSTSAQPELNLGNLRSIKPREEEQMLRKRNTAGFERMAIVGEAGEQIALEVLHQLGFSNPRLVNEKGAPAELGDFDIITEEGHHIEVKTTGSDEIRLSKKQLDLYIESISEHDSAEIFYLFIKYDNTPLPMVNGQYPDGGKRKMMATIPSNGVEFFVHDNTSTITLVSLKALINIIADRDIRKGRDVGYESDCYILTHKSFYSAQLFKDHPELTYTTKDVIKEVDYAHLYFSEIKPPHRSIKARNIFLKMESLNLGLGSGSETNIEAEGQTDDSNPF